jgi:penicillin amidase
LASAEGWYDVAMGDEVVEVFRDRYGVPHVYATSFRGVWFGQGYVAAEDRLWQMEMYRRDAKGELAELLGARSLEKDRRTRGRSHTEAERLRVAASLSAEHRAVLEGFRDGVNAYIERATVSGALPKQYADIPAPDGERVVPRPWQVTDSIAIAEMMADRFGSGGADEVEFQQLLDRLIARHGEDAGWAIFNDVVPRNDLDAPTTMPKTYRVRYQAARQTPPVAPGSRADAPMELLQAYRSGRESDVAVAREIGSFTGMGSNAWVVAPARSASGNAVLFGGPMMGFGAPQIAYEVHLNGPAYPDGSGTLNVIGMAFAGLPTVLIGHNATAAWTTTSGGGNVSDLYIESLDAEDSDRYQFRGESLEFVRIPQAIRVRQEDGAMAEETLEVLRSVHGPVVSRNVTARRAVAVKHSFWQDEAYNVLPAFLGLNRAASVEDFLAACSRIQTTHNFFYADQKGDIAYAWVGRYPIRRDGHDWRLPSRGTGEDEWVGFLPFADLPHSVNPDQAYFGNWNNKPSDEWESIFGRVFWGHRIYKRLAENDAGSLQDVKDLAWEAGTNDFIADYLHRYLMLATQHPSLGGVPEAMEVAGIAQEYDGVRGVGAAGERVYDTFARELLREVFADEMPWLFVQPLDNTSFLLLASLLLRVFEPEDSYLQPSRDYLNGYSRDDVLASALRKTLAALGSDASHWGEEPRHIALGAAGTVPWARRGTYMQIVELSSPDVRGWNVLPPGQSEDPSSPHFADQVELFRNWDYKPTVLRREQLGP